MQNKVKLTTYVTTQNLGRLLIELMEGFPIGLAAPGGAELITFSCPYIQLLKTAQ